MTFIHSVLQHWTDFRTKTNLHFLAVIMVSAGALDHSFEEGPVWEDQQPDSVFVDVMILDDWFSFDVMVPTVEMIYNIDVVHIISTDQLVHKARFPWLGHVVAEAMAHCGFEWNCQWCNLWRFLNGKKLLVQNVGRILSKKHMKKRR